MASWLVSDKSSIQKKVDFENKQHSSSVTLCVGIIKIVESNSGSIKKITENSQKKSSFDLLKCRFYPSQL